MRAREAFHCDVGVLSSSNEFHKICRRYDASSTDSCFQYLESQIILLNCYHPTDMFLDRMESSDVLIVTKLDRLGRNAMDVRQQLNS